MVEKPVLRYTSRELRSGKDIPQEVMTMLHYLKREEIVEYDREHGRAVIRYSSDNYGNIVEIESLLPDHEIRKGTTIDFSFCFIDKASYDKIIESLDDSVDYIYGRFSVIDVPFSPRVKNVSMSFEGATFRDRVSFGQNTFEHCATFDRVIFEGLAWFGSAIFNSSAGFNHATFSSWSTFHEAKFNRGASFDKASFSDHTSFQFSVFNGASFNNVTFSGEVSFYNVTFSGLASFNNAVFSKIATFADAKFATASFYRTIFSAGASFNNATSSGLASFVYATFSGLVTFQGVTFSSETSFNNAVFLEEASFSDAELSNAAFDFSRMEKGLSLRNIKADGLNLNGSRIRDLTISSEQEKEMSLSLREALITESVTVNVPRLKTLDVYRATIDRPLKIRWNDNVNYAIRDKLKRTEEYEKIENIHEYVGEEMLLLKENYRKQGWYDDEDNAYVEFKRVQRKTLSFGKKTVSLVADVIGVYGTKPQRVALSMLVTMLFFALLYFIFWPDFTTMDPAAGFADRAVNSLYTSGIIFVTIGFTEMIPTGIPMFLIIVEGFMGLFLMAYFTISFSRKVLR